MAKINKATREALLSMAYSKSLRNDFGVMRKNRASFFKKKLLDLDAYIEFVTFVNAFANHTPKLFVKMEGDNFKF